MSTQPANKEAIRSKESLLAELLICKAMGWEIGFISGGIGAYTKVMFLDLLKDMNKVTQEKFWLNAGPIGDLKDYAPYLKGVVGSIETVNKKIHAEICPSKPVEPYYAMFENALSLNLKTGITIILGLGETMDDFDELKRVITKYQISKIHIYGLNPQKGTVFEKSEPPTKEYMAEWIRKLRKAFPVLDIQFGIWEDRADYVKVLLEAGANSISKYPAIKKFGSPSAMEIERQATLAGRNFTGTLTKMPKVDFDVIVNTLDFEDDFKIRIKGKIETYLKKIIVKSTIFKNSP